MNRLEIEGRRLIRVETWIIPPMTGADGWAEIKLFLLVRLNCDGVEGWGEAFILPYRAEAVASMIHNPCSETARQACATPPAFRTLAARIADKHRSIDYAAATSAIEMALWDIQGKFAGKPLRALLCDAPRRQVLIYANTWSDTRPDSTALCNRARILVSQGFRAIKFYPLQSRGCKEAAECTQAMRGTVGDDIALMLDLVSPDDPGLARALAPKVAPFQPYWFEEPVDGDDIRTLAKIRKEVGLSIVYGETQYGLPHFREALAAGAVDIINPDIAGIGGILDILEIAGMAYDERVALSPHCWNSMIVAASAMMQVCASTPNSDMAEIYPDYLTCGAAWGKPGFDLLDGQAILSDEPGLGVNIDPAELTALTYPYQRDLP